MKNLKLAILCAALTCGVVQLHAEMDNKTINKIMDEVGGPEEAKAMYEEAKKGVSEAQKTISRLQKEINEIKKDCPASALNPTSKEFKLSCAQKTAKLVYDESKLAAAQAKEAWNSKLVTKLRELIKKAYPQLKAKLGIK